MNLPCFRLLILALCACVVTAPGASARDVDEIDRRFIADLTELRLPDAIELWIETLDPERMRRLGPLINRARSSIAVLEARGPARVAAVRKLMDAHAEVLALETQPVRRADAAIERLGDVLLLWLDAEGLLAQITVGLPGPQEREHLAEAVDVLRVVLSEAEVLVDRATRSGYRSRDAAPAMHLARLVLMAAGDEIDDQLTSLRDVDDRMLDLIRLLEARRALVRGDRDAAVERAERVREDLTARPLDRLAASLLAAEAAQSDGITRRSGAANGARTPELADIERRLVEAAAPFADDAGPYGRLLMLSAALRIGGALAGSADASDRIGMYAQVGEMVDRMLRSSHARDAAALRAVIRPRLDEAIPRELDRRTMSPLVRIAEGERLARDGRMEEALAVLTILQGEEALDPHDARAAAVLLVQGHMLLDQPDRAVRAVDRVLSSGVEISDGAPLIEHAARLAHHDRERIRLTSGGAALIERTIDRRVASGSTAGDRDDWRLIAAGHAVETGAFDRAVRHLAEVRSAGWHAARVAEMRVDIARAQAGMSGTPDASGQLQAVRTAREEVARALREAGRDTGSGEGRSPHGAARSADIMEIDRRLLLQEAELRLELEGGASALRSIEAMGDASTLSSEMRSGVLRLRIAALRALGRDVEAERDLAALLRNAGSGSSAADVEQILLGMLSDAVRRVRATELEEGPEAAGILAGREIEPLVRMASERVDSAGAPLQERMLVAEALRRSGALEEARGRLEWLEREHPDAAEVLFNLAEVLQASQEPARAEVHEDVRRAMAIYRRLVASGPRGDDDTVYWTSQLRMLEIAERAGERPEQIPPRIRRLRAQDERLGGPALRRAFERLEARIAASSG